MNQVMEISYDTKWGTRLSYLHRMTETDPVSEMANNEDGGKYTKQESI
jgi:hypothetical protein